MSELRHCRMLFEVEMSGAPFCIPSWRPRITSLTRKLPD